MMAVIQRAAGGRASGPASGACRRRGRLTGPSVRHVGHGTQIGN